MIRLFLALSIFCLTTTSFAAKSGDMAQCKNSLIQAADTIQNISNKVPDKAFGRFIRTGGGTALIAHLIKIGGSLNPDVGGKILFAQAKTVMIANKSAISSAASRCQRPCKGLGDLQKKCQTVTQLAGYLNKISLALGKKVAWTVRNMGGTSGFKKSVSKAKVSTSRAATPQRTQRTTLAPSADK